MLLAAKGFIMNTIFNSMVTISETVPFNMDWKNGTGYLDGASKGPDALVFQDGMSVTTVDNYNRKVLIISCGVDGNAVVFQRFADCGDAGVLVGNIPQCIVVKANAAAAAKGEDDGTVH